MVLDVEPGAPRPSPRDPRRATDGRSLPEQRTTRSTACPMSRSSSRAQSSCTASSTSATSSPDRASSRWCASLPSPPSLLPSRPRSPSSPRSRTVRQVRCRPLWDVPARVLHPVQAGALRQERPPRGRHGQALLPELPRHVRAPELALPGRRRCVSPLSLLPLRTVNSNLVPRIPAPRRRFLRHHLPPPPLPDVPAPDDAPRARTGLGRPGHARGDDPADEPQQGLRPAHLWLQGVGAGAQWAEDAVDADEGAFFFPRLTFARLLLLLCLSRTPTLTSSRAAPHPAAPDRGRDRLGRERRRGGPCGGGG